MKPAIVITKINEEQPCFLAQFFVSGSILNIVFSPNNFI